jgi:hypothetical protein
VTRLKLKGAVINSHTRGEYLDDPKFWPIFEAAEALDVPVYIHPNTPPPDMIGPLLARGLDGAIYGFVVECGMHLLRAGSLTALRIYRVGVSRRDARALATQCDENVDSVQ